MDFRQSTQNNGRPTPTPAPTASQSTSSSSATDNPLTGSKWVRILIVVIFFGVAVLLAFLALGFTKSENNTEEKYVSTSKYQAVFLNNGQVYFGNIRQLNSNYFELANVYYLTQTTGTTDAASGYTLVKLGCQQIHDPTDQMIINRSQVTFWENLEDSGKVVTSIKEFIKTNPKGPDCSQVSAQTQASGTSTTQGSTTPTTQSTTTGTGSTTKQ